MSDTLAPAPALERWSFAAALAQLEPFRGAQTPSGVARVVVTGGRNYRDIGRVDSVLTNIVSHAWKHGCTRVDLHTGDCPTGADNFAKLWCLNEHRSLPSVTHTPWKADWRTQGRAAGPIRNRTMLQGAKPHLVVAFPGGKGTRHCTMAAKLMGIPVICVGEDR